jgi:hypothetical protein
VTGHSCKTRNGFNNCEDAPRKHLTRNHSDTASLQILENPSASNAAATDDKLRRFEQIIFHHQTEYSGCEVCRISATTMHEELTGSVRIPGNPSDDNKKVLQMKQATNKLTQSKHLNKRIDPSLH